MEFPWEDYLLERKTENDLKDLLKTMVAFANSVKPGHKAIILIGERDDGTAQGVKNPESINQTIRKEAEKIYPPIIWRPEVYEKDGKHCVRIEIEYSGETPHFGGIAWIRKGTSTIVASDEVFQRLIDLRSSKVRELGKWIGKKISMIPPANHLDTITTVNANVTSELGATYYEVNLSFVNLFWITVVVEEREVSIPVEDIKLSFDDKKQRLLIMFK
jgi:Putative DNA-binding domain